MNFRVVTFLGSKSGRSFYYRNPYTSNKKVVFGYNKASKVNETENMAVKCVPWIEKHSITSNIQNVSLLKRFYDVKRILRKFEFSGFW